ncbi:MAG: hypothetical protein M3R15_27265 [Acidobacteriota bacterium]|nr:hypothetical protein [Acidobacteriota bacterium]
MDTDLSSGTRIGRYEIQSKLGAGGMGEVYLAEDTQLGRQVALKLLPENLTNNKERLSRFRQEARVPQPSIIQTSSPFMKSVKKVPGTLSPQSSLTA